MKNQNEAPQDDGGSIDTPVSEAVVNIEIVHDRLIVVFERSTWELIYTGVEAPPLVWLKLS